MTDLSILEHDEERAEVAVARAMRAFDMTIDALDDAVSKLRAEYHKGEGTVLKDLKAMNAAFMHAMETEKRTRDALGKQRVGTGAGALDLDGARDEIRLRLACLRDACDG